MYIAGVTFGQGQDTRGRVGRRRFAAVLLATTFVLGCASGAPSRVSEPASLGSLLIVGGGPIPDAVLERFVALAGGPGRARIVLYPMASESTDAGVELAQDFEKLGATARRQVLTRTEADSDAAVAAVSDATGIWFGGGDQAKLTAVLLGTRVEAAISGRYRAGAVVGGTSAGAAVMSTPMITGDERHPGGSRPPAADSSDAWMTIARDNVVTASGFGLLPGTIVDQHFVRRRRNNRLLSLVLENPQLIGVGIDESTALEVRPDGTWKVLGDSVAVVFDARKAALTKAGSGPPGAADVRLSVLPAGSVYDPRTGSARLP